jgi:hypothetical protein
VKAFHAILATKVIRKQSQNIQTKEKEAHKKSRDN